jgi:pimeloyl-ACP methyl ester carboxylesterase
MAKLNPPPSSSRQYFTAQDGERLSYLRIGKGKPVLLLHGFLASAELNWFQNGVAQCLASRGAMVIAPDLRGHGHSGRSPASYAGDLLVRDQEDLIRHLSLRDFAIGGYSLGSRLAIRMLVRGARPKRACLGGMGDSGILDPAKRQVYLEDLITKGSKSVRPEAAAFVQQMMERQGLSAGPLLQVLAQQRATTTAELAKLRTPIQLVCGMQDADNGSPEGLASLLPDASLVRVPGDHLSAVRTPELREAYCQYLLS